MATTRRERIREAAREEIKAAAWEQITRSGAAALSLRAIAADLELTAPALYRYFPSRDDLVTALVVDAYTDFAAELAAARDRLPAGDYAGRYAGVGRAYRVWALAFPQRFNLIFGTPIPGYHAPAEITRPAAAGGFGVLMSVIEEAWNAGALRLVPEYQDPPLELLERFDRWRALYDMPAAPQVLLLALISWARVHGLVSLELYEQFPPDLIDPSAVFEIELAALLSQVGLKA